MTGLLTRPLTTATWKDLVTVFGGGDGKGDCGRCWCMWWRLPRRGIAGFARGENKALFHERVATGPPPGLVGYAGCVPVGWVQVGPRADVPEWNRPGRVTAPLEEAEAEDPAVWGVSCFVIRVGHRRKGYSAELLSAAVAWARENGARVLDACPVAPEGKRPSTALYHGLVQNFAREGFREIARRRPDRPLMRREF